MNPANATVPVALCALISACSPRLEEQGAGQGAGGPHERVLDFDGLATGSLPTGWRVGGTRQEGPLASWQVVADPTAPSPPNALALVSSRHGSGSTFNLCWSDQPPFADGVIEVSFRADRGQEDQGGGPMWRVQGEGDYYICRVNPLESNFRLYRVQGGQREQLASTRVEVPASSWHRIRVEHRGEHILCTLDGANRLEATDGRLPGAGGVGLWTKADAETSFDDLRIRPEP